MIYKKFKLGSSCYVIVGVTKNKPKVAYLHNSEYPHWYPVHASAEFWWDLFKKRDWERLTKEEVFLELL